MLSSYNELLKGCVMKMNSLLIVLGLVSLA